MTIVRIFIEPICNPGIFSSLGDMEVVTVVRRAPIFEGIVTVLSGSWRGRESP